MSEIKLVDKFVVKRSEWIRGVGSNNSRLLVDNKRCCVGFLAQAMGFTDAQMLNQGELRDISHPTSEIGNLATALATENKYFDDCSIYGINDDEDEYYSDEVREEILTEMFSRLGITVTFED